MNYFHWRYIHDLKGNPVYAGIRRYGSITKAADSLFITQSALSKAVKNIERQLGSPLFSRIGNDLIPTHIGNRYMDYAEKSARYVLTGIQNARIY